MKKWYLVTIIAAAQHPMKDRITGTLDIKIDFNRPDILSEQDAINEALSYVKTKKFWKVWRVVVQGEVRHAMQGHSR